MLHEHFSPGSFCTTYTPLAIVGVSDRDFGGAIYKTLKARGYFVVAVNPNRSTFDGDVCYPSLCDLPAEIKRAVVAVSPESAMMVVADAVAARFTHLWFQQGKDFGAAIALAENHGIVTVSRRCILMYTEPVDGIHRFHRFVERVIGRY